MKQFVITSEDVKTQKDSTFKNHLPSNAFIKPTGQVKAQTDCAAFQAPNVKMSKPEQIFDYVRNFKEIRENDVVRGLMYI